MKKVDKFFKDKLESHSVAPPDGAWAKVESNLSKKNNVIAWRIAAAILLMGTLITAIIWSQQNSVVEKNELAQSPIKKEIEKSIPAAGNKLSENKVEENINPKHPEVESLPGHTQNGVVGTKRAMLENTFAMHIEAAIRVHEARAVLLDHFFSQPQIFFQMFLLQADH